MNSHYEKYANVKPLGQEIGNLNNEHGAIFDKLEFNTVKRRRMDSHNSKNENASKRTVPLLQEIAPFDNLNNQPTAAFDMSKLDVATSPAVVIRDNRNEISNQQKTPIGQEIPTIDNLNDEHSLVFDELDDLNSEVSSVGNDDNDVEIFNFDVEDEINYTSQVQHQNKLKQTAVKPMFSTNCMFNTPDRKSLLLQAPHIIAEIVNSGNYDKLRVILCEILAPNCTFQTKAMRNESTNARQDFYEVLVTLTETRPDFILTTKKSLFDRKNGIIVTHVKSCGTEVFADTRNKEHLLDTYTSRPEFVEPSVRRKMDALKASGTRGKFVATGKWVWVLTLDRRMVKRVLEVMDVVVVEPDGKNQLAL